VNRADVAQRLGKYPPPPGASDIPAWKSPGRSKDRSGVHDWRVGDRVCALLTGGGYAEYRVAPAPNACRFRAGSIFVAARPFPKPFFTVWTNVFERAG